ncbi:MAG: nicotinate-nucleotide--dimethylbenzimidazole phosphoribosyltransferase [Rhodobiaceae bacterium]|nr:MAG: nicotinate-nucleotide--dimethylbenzimidazole phosphoribosyltransferase [Rhodobiaceae bacterium]
MVRATTGLPFDDIRKLIEGPPLPDTEAAEAVRQGAPAGLGQLQELAEWLAAWQGRRDPAIVQPLIGIFAANHGIVAQNVSEAPATETQAQVELVAAGGAPVSRAVLQSNVGLKVFDLALDLPTPDISQEDAFDEAGCAATVAFGMEAIAGGADLLCVSDIGVGNRIVAAALVQALFGGQAADWLPDEPNDTLRENQFAAVEAAVARVEAGDRDPLEILRRIGGREFAAIAGAILAARYQKVPVLLDGFVSVASAAVLQALNPAMVAHCRVSEAQNSASMSRLLAETGLVPLLDLGLSGGRGLGSVLAIDLCRTATVAVHE